jgi:Iap family predicted aminopeptidase
MTHYFRPLLCSFLLLLCGQTVWGAPQAVTVSSLDQFEDEFKAVPCRNADRQEAVKTLFERMGVTTSEMAIDKYKRVENVVIRKPGTSDGVIVIGAHYDKVNDGCGALDNWTGIVTIAHLYRSLKSVATQKTIFFVGFGKEEEGLVGSRAMVDKIKTNDEYCAMINVDSLGLAEPEVMDNTSNSKLGKAAEELAKELKVPFSHARIDHANADSSSFIARNIPAVTITGMTNDWRKILHSRKDQATTVIPDSVFLGYRLALALVTRVDKSPCDAYKY